MNEEMKINDGNGVYDKYGVIDSCVKDLCSVKVRVDELATTGVLLADVVNRLLALKDGLEKEDKTEEQKKHGTETDSGRWNRI